jgi:hypothetical protein
LPANWHSGSRPGTIIRFSQNKDEMTGSKLTSLIVYLYTRFEPASTKKKFLAVNGKKPVPNTD